MLSRKYDTSFCFEGELVRRCVWLSIEGEHIQNMVVEQPSPPPLYILPTVIHEFNYNYDDFHGYTSTQIIPYLSKGRLMCTSCFDSPEDWERIRLREHAKRTWHAMTNRIGLWMCNLFRPSNKSCSGPLIPLP